MMSNAAGPTGDAHSFLFRDEIQSRRYATTTLTWPLTLSHFNLVGLGSITCTDTGGQTGRGGHCTFPTY